MTTLGSFAHSLGSQPTVKCSTCDIDVELAQLADHRCTPSMRNTPGPDNVYESYPRSANAIQLPFTAEPVEIDQPHVTTLPERGQSLYRRQRPSLPRIDPNVSNKAGRGLDPRKAANIAHDLGLPSPVSAGPGRRSPRPPPSRQGSAHRIPMAPPSPELPISQDCAFPPFPTNRPKRAQTNKESHGPQPRSLSRAKTHDATLSASTSSSLYSSGSSGLLKSRTSDTSSYQRSRQGTVNGAPSPPSTAPSSARNSLDHSSEHRREHEKVFSADHDVQSVFERERQGSIPITNNYSLAESVEDDSTLSQPYSVDDHQSLERVYSAPQQRDFEHSAGTGPATSFDQLLSQERQVFDSSDLQHTEPSYKSKRPPPLDDISIIPPERQFPAVGARTPAAPTTGGLGRTLSKMFSRKRSQSVSSKKAARFDVNGPRLKALAPELPPPVPLKAVGDFGTAKQGQDSYFSLGSSDSHSTPASGHDAVSPLTTSEYGQADETDDVAARDVVSPSSTGETTRSDLQADQDTITERSMHDESSFDFKFNGGSQSDTARKTDTMMIQTDFDNALATISPPSNSHPEISLQRASIDSASSYGSVRFSHNTISTRSSPPPNDELRNQISNALRASTATIDMQSIPDENTYNHTDTTQGLSVETNIPIYKEPRSPGKTARSPDLEQTSPIDSFGSPSRFKTGNKGTCRGCNQIIEHGQKSVSSKDGQLTGRYHKACFACHECKTSFATAEFYVFQNHPYCSHHYHVLNKTLCTSCGHGIEGQYFGTDPTGTPTGTGTGTGNDGNEVKFHPKCFCCATCKIQLQYDYFEFQGHVYCERDAFRAASPGPTRSYDNAPSRPSPLNREYLTSGAELTKGRFPERRTTRLMMT